MQNVVLLCCHLGLVQKAKKAKDKFLKRDGDERTETSYESFYYGGVDPYMWEPQELGETAKIPSYYPNTVTGNGTDSILFIRQKMMSGCKRGKNTESI